MEEHEELLSPTDSQTNPEVSVQIDVQSDISLPPIRHESSFSGNIVRPTMKINHLRLEKTMTCLRDIDNIIRKKIDIIENLDISVSVVTYKIYDATHDFKNKINHIKEERAKLLTSVDNKSELSLILHDLDQRISDLNQELYTKTNNYNQQKITYQEKIEEVISQLDEHVINMETMVKDLRQAFCLDQGLKPQLSFMSEKYIPNIKNFDTNLQHYLQLQVTGWRVERSEEKLADLLEEQGLKVTPSNKLLTKSGSLITFEEAHRRGYLKEIDASLDKTLEFFADVAHDQELLQPVTEPDTDILSASGGSLDSKICSEDVKYLKHNVGRPLTQALADILAKQPRDPIHYLAHYLFKYRYNQELEMMQKKEMDELTRERAIMAEKIWRKFIEDEARAAVIDMVLRSEEIAFQNELRRILEAQLLAAQEEVDEEGENAEENALMEEAKDKFE